MRASGGTALVASLALAACDAGPSAGADASPRVDASSLRDTSSDAATALSDAPAENDAASGSDPCDTPTRGEPAGAACLRSVEGLLVDLAGAPLAGLAVTVCGPVCFLAESDAAGRFFAAVDARVDPSIYSVIVHARPDHASLYAPLPALVPGGALRFDEPLVAPRYTVEGDALPPRDATAAATLRVGPLELAVPAGTRLDVDVEDAALGALGRRLRLAPVPVDRAPRALREAGAELVWALAPFNIVASRPLGLRVRNDAGWPAGVAVDVLALGRALLEPPFDAGRAVRVATARVTDDGATVRTGDAEGLPALTWLALRRAR